MTTPSLPSIRYDFEKGFTTNKFPGIEFIIDRTIGNFDLNQTFKLLYETIPGLNVEHLPINIFEKKLIRFVGQDFQFDNNLVLNNLRSLDVEVNVPFSRLRSIHCESQNYADDECQLIYILNVNSEVSVRYQLVNDDLTYEDIDDRTTANLIAMFYTYNISTNSIIFDNAELVLFESHENTTFEGKLIYYPDKFVY